MANIIASGTTETASADFTLTAGTPTTVFLVGVSGPAAEDARAIIQIKSSGGVYIPVGELNRSNQAQTLFGGGTYRVVREASGTAFAVERD
jgi:hypothetical protein